MKNIFSRIFVVLFTVLLASCLEDDRAALDPEGTQNIIEFLDPSVPSSPAGSIYPAYSTSFLLVPEATYEITLSYSGPRENDKDIQLQLALDPAAISVFNTHMESGLYGSEALNGTTYELMPEANYSIPTFSVTIPAGKKTAVLPITVYPLEFEFGHNYAIPLKIVSSSHGTLSSNFSTALFALGVRNDYDGVYEIIDGNMFRNGPTGPDPVLGGDYVDGLTMDLVTLSSNSVGIEPLWKDGSGVGGVTGTNLTIDPATNLVTVRSTGNASLKNTPATINQFYPDGLTITDEETGDEIKISEPVFVLNFDWGTAPSDRKISDLMLRFVGPRP